MTGRWLLWLACFTSPWFYGFLDVTGQPVACTDILLPGCLLVWLVQKKHQLSGLGLALACFAIAALISVVAPLAEGRPASTVLKVIRLWGIVAPAVLLSGLNCQREDWSGYLRAFFFGGAISLVTGIVGFFLQWEPVVATQTYVFDNGAYLHRAGGVFRDSGAFGHLLATWIGCGFLLFAPELRSWSRAAAYGSMITIGSLGLYTSVSRSAALNIGAVLVAAAVLQTWNRHLGKRIPKVALGLAAGLLASLPILVVTDASDVVLSAGDTVAQRLIESFTSLLGGVDDIERASGGRLTTWVLALEAWSGSPLLGVGYKTLALTGNPPDNTFVLALCETGMLGFGALVFCFGLILWKAFDRYTRKDAEGRKFLILWIGQLIHSLNADILTFFGSVTPLLILTLIWYRLSTQPATPPHHGRGERAFEVASAAYHLAR